jgi:hypothetical protein
MKLIQKKIKFKKIKHSKIVIQKIKFKNTKNTKIQKIHQAG